MSKTGASTEDQDAPDRYEIRIEGHLDDRWADWFEGMTLTREDNDTTLLTGPVADQAALHGLLKRVRDLGTPLLSVSRLTPDQAEAPDRRHDHDDEQPGERHETDCPGYGHTDDHYLHHLDPRAASSRPRSADRPRHLHAWFRC